MRPIFRRIAPFALILFVCACAGGPIITRVDQAALFRPNLVHYGAAEQRLLLEIHGAPLPAGTSRAQLSEAMTLPGQYHPIRFVLDGDSASANDKIRMVLIANPAAIPLAETVCRTPAEIVTTPGARLNIMAVLCVGSRYAAKGHVKIGAAAVTTQDIAAGLRGLFADMLRRPAKSPNNIIFAGIGPRRAGG